MSTVGFPPQDYALFGYPPQPEAGLGTPALSWSTPVEADFVGSTSYSDTNTFSSGSLTWTVHIPAGSPTVATTASGLDLTTDGTQDYTASAKACPTVTTPFSVLSSDDTVPVAIILTTTTAWPAVSVSHWGLGITAAYATSNPTAGRTRLLYASGNHQYQVQGLQAGSTSGGAATNTTQVRSVCFIRYGVDHVEVYTSTSEVTSAPSITDIIAETGWTKQGAGSMRGVNPTMGGGATPYDRSSDLIEIHAASANPAGNGTTFKFWWSKLEATVS